MIKCKIIALGSLKEKFFKEACGEYQKRLSRFCDLEICEIEPVRLPENPSAGEIENALKKEADQIIKKIPQNAKVIALCVEGKEMPSEKFAAQINEISAIGQGICFIIGSSYGLSNDVKKMADLRLSLSQMTFPHKLFRVMLLEQLYRGFMINQGSQYHK
jgi:23S rRNA (pseudouridine1915-N3)-methyltransferase